MKFSSREELAKIIKILSFSKEINSVFFELIGKSGTGKTELVKKAVNEIVNNENIFIYLDIIPDEFQATSFFRLLVETVYMPLCHHYKTISNIPEDLSLSKYIKKIVKKYRGFEAIIQSLTISASAVPTVGGPLSLLLDKWKTDNFYSIDNLLFIYFQYIIKKTRINLIIDNYQFLPDSIKRIFEAGINQFNNGFTFIVINRVDDNYKISEKFCSAFKYENLQLEYMSFEQCKTLINYQEVLVNDIQIKKIWNVTQGNLKDIEIILNEIRINPGYSIISNKIAIQNLDSIQRSILLIAALFPAGMREEYVIYFIRNILNEMEEEKIKCAIMNLINLGYICKNSVTHDTIKPTHETVINHVKEVLDTHDLFDFCISLSENLETMALNYRGTNDYTYLLHCWIGINNIDTLRQKTSLIQDLIYIKYKENSYYYIDTIALSIMDVIAYLAENCIEKILISFQRVSDFQNGINLLNNLRNIGYALYDNFKIYYAKFLIQTYEFEDALVQLRNMPDSSEKLLCQTNALQHLGFDKEVIQLLNEKLIECRQDEYYYIILRNTAHYFNYKKAKANLLLSLSYFSKHKYFNFAVATVQNNLAVVEIWSKHYREAGNFLTSAITTLEKIHSNEIFEPYCNKSILLLMKKEYNEALDIARKALLNCPKVLTLDIIMLNINLKIIELCCNKSTIEDVCKYLNQLQKEYILIEDPWYEFQLIYNQINLESLIGIQNTSLEEEYLHYIKDYNNETTKFYLLENFNINGVLVNLCLGLSPNWRY